MKEEKRSPEYAAKTVSVYREAIDLYFEGKLTPEIKKGFLEELKKVYNRGFSSGFYFDYPSSEDYANIYGSVASTRKEYAGKVINYYKKTGIAHIRMESGSIGLNDELLIIGPTTGVAELKPSEMMKDGSSVNEALKGDDITLKCA
ncbi:MAG TPA: U32 family peptidase [Ignavibacteriales bacterium]|nr:U32 family peptidase [Ignavibacteriales bacterium]